MVYLTASSSSSKSLRDRTDLADLRVEASAQYLVKLRALDDITSQIICSYQHSDPSPPVQIDESLNEFEKNIAPSLSFTFVDDNAEPDSKRQAILLHLRYVISTPIFLPS